MDQKLYDEIVFISETNGESISETIRKLLRRGLSIEYVNDSKDLIAEIVREQMEIVVKPHVERLASLSAKTGIASATSMFLNAQAFMDLVPVEKKKDARTMFEKARIKGVAYMRTRAEDWEGGLDSEQGNIEDEI